MYRKEKANASKPQRHDGRSYYRRPHLLVRSHLPRLQVGDLLGEQMSDILNIRVTERELDLIMDLLHEAGERPDADGNPQCR